MATHVFLLLLYESGNLRPVVSVTLVDSSKRGTTLLQLLESLRPHYPRGFVEGKRLSVIVNAVKKFKEDLPLPVPLPLDSIVIRQTGDIEAMRTPIEQFDLEALEMISKK